MHNDVILTTNNFNSNGYWTTPIHAPECPTYSMLSLFDQNGYDLSLLEIEYSKVNLNLHSIHRNYTHTALKMPWFVQDEKLEGSVLNHSLLFERKGYQGEAYTQLVLWAEKNPLVWKVAKYRPKWGLDFSMDYSDKNGNVFEILHYEFDGFSYDEIQQRKIMLESILINIDWDWAAIQLLKRKDDWHSLDFFAQSLYKCNFFGIGAERFKMVAWE